MTHDIEDELLEQDDAIIGRALRLSFWVIAVLAVAGLVLWFFLTRSEPVAEVTDADIAGALAGASSGTMAPPKVRFSDITRTAGIDFTHNSGAYGQRLLPETMGSGVAFFDYDNDGDQDLLFINSTDWPWEATDNGAKTTAALYRNRGDGSFDNVTAGSGLDTAFYGTGVAVADFDGDGWRDIYVAAVGSNRLFRNIGGTHFADVSESAGVSGDDDEWSTSAVFFDFDRDGDLDLFVANYVVWSREIDFEVDYRLTGLGRAYGPPTNYAGTHSMLYRNEGDGTFSDVSGPAGIEVSNPATGLAMGKGLAVNVLDIDDDGWLDIVVANDTVQNFLFRNNNDGTFIEIGATSGIAYDNSGNATGAMGVDAAWYQNDDDIAVAIGNFANEMTSFFVAQAGSGHFSDEAIVSGIGPDSRRALSFGVFFFDYDLDGRLDMLQTNGHVENEINKVQPSQQYEQPTQLFWNCGLGCPRVFVPVDEAGDLQQPVVGRGAAYGDIDADGDLDIVITQAGRAPLLLRNEQALGHDWIRLLLDSGGDNADAIGAVVEVDAGGETRRQRVSPSRSYLSQVELPLTFGLGKDPIDEIRVTWPDGSKSHYDGVTANHLYVVSPAGIKVSNPRQTPGS